MLVYALTGSLAEMPAEKITHEKIINAVLDCAFVKSVGGTSLADIAGKLGIKKASLYNHFDSREDMIEATVRYCGEYIGKIPFIPSDMETEAQRYSAETFFKKIMHRWFNITEKEPLLQIYSFIESEKYFSEHASSIASSSRTRIEEQTLSALQSLASAGKTAPATKRNLSLRAKLFANLLFSVLDSYIIEKKNYIRTNPQSGEGELFNSLPMEPDFSALDSLVAEFCRLLGESR